VKKNSEMSPRMLVLGLDAADPSLIEKWSDEGILPTLSFLRKESAWIHLSHNGAIPSASVWPSIYTGTQPGKHGIYHGVQMEPGQQKVDRVKPSQCGQPPFWRTLDSDGKRSIIMDVPFNYPLKNFNGTQILDWGTYERNYESHSLPGEVLTEISRRFSAYPFGAEMSRDAPSSVRHFSRARAQLLAGAALKGNVIKWLISSRPWDFLMAVFSEIHFRLSTLNPEHR
jgi:predicted AlkP superfamily phosphohydrolase/phosphomutase